MHIRNTQLHHPNKRHLSPPTEYLFGVIAFVAEIIGHLNFHHFLRA